MDTPTFPTLDPAFEEYLTRRLKEYADAAAEREAATSLSPPSSIGLDDEDTGNAYDREFWPPPRAGRDYGSRAPRARRQEMDDNVFDDDMDTGSPPGTPLSLLSTASCPVSPAPTRSRLGYRPQRPTYDPTRGILKSITEGNTRRLSKLLGRRSTSTSNMEDLVAPLAQAIRLGQDKCVVSLLTAGADPNAPDDEGRSPVYLVIETGGGNPEILRALLKCRGVNPDAATWNLQHTALHLAAKKGYQVCVKQLLAAGAKPDKKDAAGNTAVMFAAREGHVNIVRALLRAGADAGCKNLSNETALHAAAKGGNVDCLRLLLETGGADPNDRDARGQTPILLACKLKHAKIAECLLDYECDVDGQDTVSGKTALHWAVQNGEVNTVTELLDARANPDIRDKNWATPFLLALGAGNREVLDLLLHARCDVTVTDRSGNTALHIAASEGQADLLPSLVEAGINVDVKGPGGVTSIMLAAYKGHVSTVQELLAHHASPDLKDRNRASALIYTILSREATTTGGGDGNQVHAIVKLLIRANCDLDCCANLGKVLLQLSYPCREGPFAAVEERLYSPLEVAYMCGRSAVFMMLLRAGADTADFRQHCADDALTYHGGEPRNSAEQQQHSDQQRQRWYLRHCLQKERQQVRSLVELCRRPVIRFLTLQYKGHHGGDSLTIQQMIARLPFNEPLKAFLNYADIDEVVGKYHVTLREKGGLLAHEQQQQQQTPSKRGSTVSLSRPVSASSSTPSGHDAGKSRLSGGTLNGTTTGQAGLRQGSTSALNRSCPTRKSLPAGFYNGRGSSSKASPVARGSNTTTQRTPTSSLSSTPRRVTPAKPTMVETPSRDSVRASITRLRESVSQRSSSGTSSSTTPTSSIPSRLRTPSSTSSPSSSSSGASRIPTTPSSREGGSAINGSSSSSTSSRLPRGIRTRTGSSNNLELTRHLEEQEEKNSPGHYGSLRTRGNKEANRGGGGGLSEYERMEQAYDELRNSMIAAGSISDMSSSTSSLSGSRQKLNHKRRGHYSQIDPGQMLVSPKGGGSNNEGEEEQGFFNGELSPRSDADGSSPTHRTKLFKDAANGNRSPPPSPLVQPTSPTVPPPPSSGGTENSPLGVKDGGTQNGDKGGRTWDRPTANNRNDTNLEGSEDEWGLRRLRTGLTVSQKNESNNNDVLMDEEEEKQLLEDIMKEAESSLSSKGPKLPPDERPLRPMSEQMKKTVYDKRWAHVPNPALAPTEESTPGRFRKRNPPPLGPRGSAQPSSLQTDRNGNVSNSPRSPSSSLRAPTSPIYQLERKEVRFIPASEREIKPRGSSMQAGRTNPATEHAELGDDFYLKRWGTMTLDDPDILNNSENFTSSESLRMPAATPPPNNRPSNGTHVAGYRLSDRHTPESRLTLSKILRQREENHLRERQAKQNGYPEVGQVHAHDGRQSDLGTPLKRGSNLYSSMRVRGPYGQRNASPMDVTSSPTSPASTVTSSLERPSRKRSGMRTSKEPSDVTADASPLTSPAEKKEVLFDSQKDKWGTDKKQTPSAGSKIKMAFIRSRSFRH